jgi:FtsZ-interacting cell division protein ZipA
MPWSVNIWIIIALVTGIILLLCSAVIFLVIGIFIGRHLERKKFLESNKCTTTKNKTPRGTTRSTADNHTKKVKHAGQEEDEEEEQQEDENESFV